MKLLKKTCVIILLAFVVLNCMTFTAFADVNGGKLEVGNASGKAGDTIDVSINMSDNPGFISANIYVKYDESVLKLKEVTDGGILKGAAHSDSYTSPYGLCWMNDLATENFKVNGLLATLTFEILSNGGSETEIILQQDIIDYQLEKVTFDVSGGKITLGGGSGGSGGTGGGSDSGNDKKQQSSSNSKSSGSGSKANSEDNPNDKASGSNESNGGQNSVNPVGGNASGGRESSSASDNNGSSADSDAPAVADNNSASQQNGQPDDPVDGIAQSGNSSPDSAAQGGGFPYWIFIVIGAVAVIGAVIFICVKKNIIKLPDSKEKSDET